MGPCVRVSVAGALVSSPGWSSCRAALQGVAECGRPALGLLPMETAEQRELPQFQVTRCPRCCKKLRSQIPRAVKTLTRSQGKQWSSKPEWPLLSGSGLVTHRLLLHQRPFTDASLACLPWHRPRPVYIPCVVMESQ